MQAPRLLKCEGPTNATSQLVLAAAVVAMEALVAGLACHQMALVTPLRMTATIAALTLSTLRRFRHSAGQNCER